MSESQETDSIRADLEAVIGGAAPTTDRAEEDPVVAKDETPEPSPATKSSDRPRDESGKFVAKDGAQKDAPAEQKQALEATSTEQPKPGKATQTALPLPGDKAQATSTLSPGEPAKLVAPTSWKPLAREKWAAVPPEIQQEVHRRERDVALAIHKATELEKTATNYQTTLAPFEPIFRAEGVDVTTGLRNLLPAIAGLQTGTPARKAQIAATIIKAYGVPIDALDSFLAGQSVSDTTDPPVDPRQWIEQAKQELAQQIQEAAQQQAIAHESVNVAKFSESAEFINDVRDTMADLLEVASRRGLDLSLEDAYHRACMMDPEIAKVLRQREQAQTAQPAATQKARVASSSVRSQPAGIQSPEPDGRSIADDLRAVMAELGGR
jgi:hypothetical protein